MQVGDAHEDEGGGRDDQGRHGLHPDIALHAFADAEEHRLGPLEPVPGGEQGARLALEPAPRDEQEDQIDEDEDRAGGGVLQSAGEARQVVRQVELGHQLADGGRDLHAHLLACLLDQVVQLRGIGDQLGQEGRGVDGHLVGGQPDDEGGEDQRQRQRRLRRDELQPVLHHPGETVDDEHQEQGERQRRQDRAQPPDHRAHHHGGDDQGRRAGVMARQGLGHESLRG